MPKCLTVYFCSNHGQVLSLFPHKDNTIILKRLWSLVIESSKGTRILRDREGQLLDCGEQREKEGRRKGESIKLVGPFESWHVMLISNHWFLVNLEHGTCVASDITSGHKMRSLTAVRCWVHRPSVGCFWKPNRRLGWKIWCLTVSQANSSLVL